MGVLRKNNDKYDLTDVGGIQCQLELGKWTIHSINELLKKAWEKCGESSGYRMSYISQQFLGIPFYFESNLPILKDGILRVRLQDFDCITFIYYMLALSKARDFTEFVMNLYMIRYVSSVDRVICNNPDTGNIFDFPCDSILRNAIDQGFLYDITPDLIEEKYLEEMTVHLKRFRRPKAFDKNELFVTPKYGERIVADSFVTSASIEKLDYSTLRSGDVVVFSRGPVNKDGTKAKLLVGHFAIIIKEKEDVHFVHVTRNYTRNDRSLRKSKRKLTGVYYDAENICEQIGVSFGGIFAGHEFTLQAEIGHYHCFDQTVKRTLTDYFLNNFWGMKFMRVTDRKSIAHRYASNENFFPTTE